MNDTSPAPTGRNRRLSVALVLASVSFLLSLVSCGLAGFVAFAANIDLLPVQSTPQVASASEVEAVAHVTLPLGTVFLSSAYSNGRETRLSAKFRIPRASLDAFVAAGAFTANVTPGLRAVTANQNVGGGTLWNPDAAKVVSGLEEQQPNSDGIYRSLLIDLDAPDTVTIFLYAGSH